VLEYLEKLMEERKWEEALSYAEQLLSQVEDDPKTLLRVNMALLISRQELGEFLGAQSIGQLCVKMANELEEWKLFHVSCHYLGLAHYRVGQPDLALATWFELLGHSSSATMDPELEALVRYNIGITYNQLGDLDQATKFFSSSLQVANRSGLARLAHGVRHALLGAYIKHGIVQEVPRLLAQSLHYVHSIQDASDQVDETRLWHFLIRCQFAMATHRTARARLVAHRGLKESEGHPRLAIEFNMILARIARAIGDKEGAVGHALAARIAAIACRRYDLELAAAEFMYELISES